MVVTGIVTPYTHALFDTMVAGHGIELHALACSLYEPDRLWRLPEARSYRRVIMRGLRWHRSNESHLYFNPGVVYEIVRHRPDVVVVCDFSPTMHLAAATARLMGIPVAMSSDAQPFTDPGAASLPHRLARRAMAPLINAGIGGSEASLDVFAQYGIGGHRVAVSPVVPAWSHRGPVPDRAARRYDLLFCGLVDDRRKGALHFLETVRLLRARGRQPSIRVVGEGPLRECLRQELAVLGVEARFDGYLQKEDLPEAYLSSKLMLFPSRSDPWGLVANEAAQCGTPVLISPHAQAAFGLVERFGTGEVLPLDPLRWADAVERYLDDEDAWLRASRGGVASGDYFSLPTAAAGFVRGMLLARGEQSRSSP